MKTIIISANEANQRLDKFLMKYFNRTGSGFVYKMLRKKNFKLNGKRAFGNEILAKEDEISLFLSDETHDKMHSLVTKKSSNTREKRKGALLDIVFEDEHVLIVNKPFGLLSQSDRSGEASLNDSVLSYVLQHSDKVSEYRAFKPSICNRLDRNTSGLVICAKTYAAASNLSYLIKKKMIRKFYFTVVKGCVEGEGGLEGFILKDKESNYVTYSEDMIEGKEAKKAALKYRSLKSSEKLSLLDIELLTGKSHQIRVQLSSWGHSILGDPKYGDETMNRELRVKGQLLCAYKLIFPKTEEVCLMSLSEKTIRIEPPERFVKFFG